MYADISTNSRPCPHLRNLILKVFHEELFRIGRLVRGLRSGSLLSTDRHLRVPLPQGATHPHKLHPLVTFEPTE